MPYGEPFQIFAAGTAATATQALPANSLVAGQVALQFVTTGFSGTIDIQGKPYSGATFVNLPYVAVASGSMFPTTAQLSFTTDTSTNTFMVIMPMPVMQIVMTRSAGSLAGFGSYNEHPIELPMAQAVGAPRSPWAVNHVPGAAAQATITRAAAGAGLKNVCNSISAAFVAGGTAPAAATITLNLRDGATGAGTILWSKTLGVQAAAGSGQHIDLGGISIVGSANTAMTLEFSAAGAANTLESVAMSGSVSV